MSDIALGTVVTLQQFTTADTGGLIPWDSALYSPFLNRRGVVSNNWHLAGPDGKIHHVIDVTFTTEGVQWPVNNPDTGQVFYKIAFGGGIS